jgi:hypothetical protein
MRHERTIEHAWQFRITPSLMLNTPPTFKQVLKKLHGIMPAFPSMASIPHRDKPQRRQHIGHSCSPKFPARPNQSASHASPPSVANPTMLIQPCRYRRNAEQYLTNSLGVVLVSTEASQPWVMVSPATLDDKITKTSIHFQGNVRWRTG